MARTEHHPTGLIHYNPRLSSGGYTLFTANTNYAFLIDPKGRFVHQWRHNRGITNAELLPNGNLIALTMPSPRVKGQRGLNGQAEACIELNWDSDLVWEYKDPWIHHDLKRLPNGNTLLLRWESLPKSLVSRVKGGYREKDDDKHGMLGDAVLEVTPDGDIVHNWKSWHHLDPSVDIICPLDDRREWTHANSIDTAPNGDWVISFRRISTIIRVKPNTGAIKWRFNDESVRHQHDARFISGNRVTFFDNGVHRKGIEYSRAVEISARSKKIVWSYMDNPPFTLYTIMGGSVERLPNGNTLICETSKGHFLEVTQDGKVVWEYINPMFTSNPRLGGRINMVFKVHRYSAGFPGLKGQKLKPENLAGLNRQYGTQA